MQSKFWRRVFFASAVFVLAAANNVAQQAPTPESPQLSKVQNDVASGKPAALDQFWKTVSEQKTPLIERLSGDPHNVLATFLWKDDGETKDVVVDARPNGVNPPSDPRSHMRRLPGTDIWYLTHRLPADAEFLYQLLVNLDNAAPLSNAVIRAAVREDPFNPNLFPEKDDPAAAYAGRSYSIARMPDVAAAPWIKKRTGVAAGAIQEHLIKSAVLTIAAERQLWVYSTPGQLSANPNLLIMFDGRNYQADTPVALDNLFAEHKIGPTVAVFIDNGGATARSTDLYFSDAFTKFLINELLPWVQQEYKFKATASRTVVGGSSLGGLAAAYVAFRRPDIFGKVISQSGSFQVQKKGEDNDEPEWLARQLARAPKSDVFFCLEVGRMEYVPPGPTSLLASNRHLRDILQAKGYAVHYFEMSADHDPIHWRRALPEALLATLAN
jgi:enterochelin esterase family protein